MSKTSDETQRLGERHRVRSQVNQALDRIDNAIAAFTKGLDNIPEKAGFTAAQVAETLTDNELLALDAWTDGMDFIIRSERDRRASRYEQQLREFRPNVLRADI
jgi:hypothetical protein